MLETVKKNKPFAVGRPLSIATNSVTCQSSQNTYEKRRTYRSAAMRKDLSILIFVYSLYLFRKNNSSLYKYYKSYVVLLELK